MMWPLWAERRAARFAAAVEGRRDTGSLHADTAALVGRGTRREAVEQPALRPEFAADLRVRLLDAAPALLASDDPSGASPPAVRTAGVPRRGRPGAGDAATR